MWLPLRSDICKSFLLGSAHFFQNLSLQISCYQLFFDWWKLNVAVIAYFQQCYFSAVSKLTSVFRQRCFYFFSRAVDATPWWQGWTSIFAIVECATVLINFSDLDFIKSCPPDVVCRSWCVRWGFGDYFYLWVNFGSENAFTRSASIIIVTDSKKVNYN